MLDVGAPSTAYYHQLESRSSHTAAARYHLLLMDTGTIDGMSAKYVISEEAVKCIIIVSLNMLNWERNDFLKTFDDVASFLV